MSQLHFLNLCWNCNPEYNIFTVPESLWTLSYRFYLFCKLRC
jgi:hypothetical protein